MRNQGVGNWIHRRRMKSEARTALIAGDHKQSYEVLADRIDQLAHALQGRGVASGDRVAYLGENHPAFLETLFACGLIGAIFVPLNTRLAPREIQFALQDSESHVFIFSQELQQVATAAVPGTEVEHQFVVNTSAADEEMRLYENFLNTGARGHQDNKVTLDDPAIILYTSGTTGRPKGAVLTHGNLTWNSLNVIVDYDVVSNDIALMISPMFHVASLGMGVLPTFLKGGTVVLEPRFDPGRALHLIEYHRASFISGVPTTYQMLAEHPDWANTDLSSLQKLTCGGSTVPLRVLEEYEKRGLSFSQGYGLTETSPGTTALMPNRTRERMGSVGLPHFFTSVRIADSDSKEVSPRTIGEVQVSGPNVITEYWKRPDATAEAYTADGWFRTEDLGYVDNEGFLFISDRLKDMIISGGENIYPVEVEQLIVELEPVSSAAVIGVPDERWGEVPVAVVEIRPGHGVTVEEIRNHLEGRLARYKIPKQYSLIDEMPRTASGKVRKASLREQHTR